MPELFEGVPVLTRVSCLEALAAPIPESGAILLMDKPQGWTSFDVVAKVRNTLRMKKVGHAGTLDPMATGLLVLCLARATKLADRIQGGIKTYTGAIRFGATTTTDDAEGDLLEQFAVDHLTADDMHRAAATFVGDQLQRPPKFSARKVGGQRMYKLARRGQEVEIAPASITVYRFDLTEIAIPTARFIVECSKGTYIRSLARDMGEKLGTGAHLEELRRTHSGQFDVADAITIPQLLEAMSLKAAPLELTRREDDRS